MLHLMLPKFNPCSWKSLGEPKTGCVPFWISLADSRKHAYLIFVILFTRAKFLENKIYIEKRQFFALNL